MPVLFAALLLVASASSAAAASGDLDETFSGDGKKTTDIGAGSDAADDVAIQPNGRIVAVGRSAGDYALARYRSGGALDGSFGGDGKVTAEFGEYEGAEAVAIQADGKMVVVGSAGEVDAAIVRFGADGTPDSSFGGDGQVVFDTGKEESLHGVALQPNGRIVAAGRLGGNFLVARFNPNGTPDATFSGNGWATAKLRRLR
ncbi:MAG TPA: delta-60 repeat domain-containing protein [Actinomycetota bacterium]|nr:delta-60 repeat domain-containing protein [Actinomycetota bacterium]